MHSYTSVLTALLGSAALLVPRAAADCCTLDDPIGPFRTCSPLATKAETPFLVKAVNYTRYRDTLGGGTFDPNPRWNSLQVMLARATSGPNDPLGCSAAKDPSKCTVTSAPVCVLIDCVPLNQDDGHATNDGKTQLTDLVVAPGVPAGAGPDGPWYDLASTEYDRHETGPHATLANLSASAWRKTLYGGNQSSLQYDNNWLGFNLTGMSSPSSMNGTNGGSGFYPFELQGHPWPDFDLRKVPCGAYPCARRCAHAALGSKFEADYTPADLAEARACIDQCAGVDAVVNYCPDVYGGKRQVITPQELGLDSQAALDAYVPDGCARWERAAFPAAAASYSASMASKTARPSPTSSAATSKEDKSSSSASGRGEGCRLAALTALTALMVKVGLDV
ncbi:hypothetical protein PG993_013144 [Apiospora rasikravindrae]|uniref:Uncharacterized protein n=1 Tax=Apiospora rasikravindrae TaxID=990691 RepID=A0ABR1RWU4_9PEZI